MMVQFTDTSTDSDGVIVSWSWNFGDGTTSTLQNPTHQYSSTGTYTVTLTVTDDDGATDSESQSITVSEAITPYVVYSDAGIPSDSDIYTWDSYRNGHGGTGEATFDANYTGVTGIPEGSECFLMMSNNGNTYAGWGVFLVRPSSHTVDLSSYNQLKFWVKSAVNLKVGVQDTGASGTKKEVYISSYGWNWTNTWQEITIPKSAFSPVDFTQIFGPFMITVESGNQTFYVDNVRWV